LVTVWDWLGTDMANTLADGVAPETELTANTTFARDPVRSGPAPIRA
jgi:hypothetical protein